MPSPGARGGRARRAYLCSGCRTRLRPPPPPRCGRCDAPLGTGGQRCRECEEWPVSLFRARSAAILAPPADTLVYALKYGGWPESAAEMASGMSRLLAREAGFDGAVLVPVPTTRGRERKRGYNQAAVLARELARPTGRTVVEALARTGRGGTQVALHRDERRANVQGAFRMRDEALASVRGRPVVLVDDVLTTGATAAEAAEVLTRGGAGPVLLLAFARALPGRIDDPAVADPPPGFFRFLRGRASIGRPLSSDPETGRS
jgi:ComF family protein